MSVRLRLDQGFPLNPLFDRVRTFRYIGRVILGTHQDHPKMLVLERKSLKGH